MSSKVGAVFSALADLALDTEESVVFPDVANLATNVSSNPSAASLLTQGTLFLAEVSAAQPKIAQGLIADVAPVLASLAQKAQADLAAAQAKLAAALAGTAGATPQPQASATK